jgi:hypothetical protein
MKRNFSKLIGTSAIVASLAVLPLNLSAQAQTSTDGTGTTTRTTTPNTGVYNDSANTDRGGFDWGWLGLLGLLGLAGLAGKNRSEEPTRYRDPNAAGTTGYRE